MLKAASTVLGLVFIWGIVLLVFRWNHVWWWVEVHTGTRNEAGPYYAFWSGFGSDLGEYVLVSSVFSGLWMHYKHLNCHSRDGKLPWGCWRLGHYAAAGGQYKLCHKHHPDLAGEHPSPGLIHLHHAQHKAATRANL